MPHHVVADAVSLDILIRDLAQIYRQLGETAAPKLPPLPVQYEAVQRQGLRSAWIAADLSTAFAIAIYLASGLFLGLFTADPEVHEAGSRLLWLTIFLQPFFAFNMILLHALRAVEDVRWPVLANQLLSWGLGLPLAWVLCVPMGLGVEGVWLALIVDELAKALAMVFRWQCRSSRPPALAGRVVS